MRDSMNLIRQLARRGYLGPEVNHEGEGRWTLGPPRGEHRRVIIRDGSVELLEMGPGLGLKWSAQFIDGTPMPVILAVMDAAETETRKQNRRR